MFILTNISLKTHLKEIECTSTPTSIAASPREIQLKLFLDIF
jgi:hypothetical protein